MAGKKILIADDEQEILEILEKKLKQNGYEVISFSKGKDAVEGSKLHKPDLIILDIAMPEMDGYNVALALREEEVSKSAPIIFMTAKELEYSGIQKRLAEISYCDFIAKPCVFEDLLAKVKKMIG
jgi:two-component system response regulator VicR